jgi:hypothetical protein
MMLKEDHPDVTAKYRIGDQVHRIARLERSGGELIVMIDVEDRRIAYPWSQFRTLATKVGNWL